MIYDTYHISIPSMQKEKRKVKENHKKSSTSMHREIKVECLTVYQSQPYVMVLRQ